MADPVAPLDPNDPIGQMAKDIRTQGKLDGIPPAQLDQLVQVMTAVARQRAKEDPKFVENLSDLFHKRPEIAKKLVDKIVDVGGKSADKLIDFDASALAAMQDVRKLASASTTELDKKYQETSVSWGGFWLGVGKFLQGIPGLQGAAQWCLETAERMQPQALAAHTGELQRGKDTAEIRTDNAVKAATGIFDQAIAMTDLKNPKMRYGDKDLVDLHETEDAARHRVGKEAPTRMGRVSKEAAGLAPDDEVAPVSQTSSIGDIQNFAKDIATKVASETKTPVDKLNDIKNTITAKMVQGNGNAKIDGNEGKEIIASPAYNGLDEAQKAKINGMLGIDAAGNIVKPVEGLDKEKVSTGPVPAGMAYNHS